MTLIHCSGCMQRPQEKPAQVTWAWNQADRVRVAYRQRLCVQCFCTRVLALDRPITDGERLTCPACGIDTELDYDAVYVTAYVPGAGKQSFEWPFCDVHAAEVRIRAQENAEFLPDRLDQSRGLAPGTAPSRPDPWAALGITPRE